MQIDTYKNSLPFTQMELVFSVQSVVIIVPFKNIFLQYPPSEALSRQSLNKKKIIYSFNLSFLLCV